MLILVAGMLIISQIMLIFVGWMVFVTVSMLIIVQCMPSPLPRLSTLIVKVGMQFAVQSMLILVHSMLIIDDMLNPLPLPRVSQGSLCGHSRRSFQLKKERYELLGQLAEIEKLALVHSWAIVILMNVNFGGENIRISPDWLKFNLIEGVVEVGDVGVPGHLNVNFL